MKRTVLFLVGVFLSFSLSAFAAELPPCAAQAFRRALDADAAWTLERRFACSTRTLVSTGLVSCAVGRGIVWDVRHPFPSSVTMTTNAMIFVDEEGRREKSLDDLPHYAEIRKMTDAFVAGDSKAFDGVFGLAAATTGDGGWVMTLTPEVRAMRRLFASIELSGAETITNAVLKTEDGGSSVIRFTELARGAHGLWKDVRP